MKTKAADAPVGCASCKAAKCQQTVVTQRGAYYRCSEYGHMWHVDRPLLEEPPSSQTRMKSDRAS